MQEVPWVSSCSPLEKLVRTTARLMTHRKLGTGHKKSGPAHSSSQLIGPQINQISNGSPDDLLRLPISELN
jgi:hypothetical protein